MNAPAGTSDRGGAPLQAPVYRKRPWRQRHVHLGLGAFSRAHILVYADKLLAAGQSDWGVVGANLRSDDITSKLGRQDGLYTLVQSDGAHASARVIGSLGAALGGADRPATIERLSDPNVAFVTVTVSEKGYGYDASRRLDLTQPAIADDLVHPTQPSSLVGTLVEALLRRRQAKAPALTIASCDNIAGNGELLRALVLSFAERRDPTLVEWVESNATFPSTMVDRIVPATTDRLRTLAKELTGSEDPVAVGAEPFSQWVIQSSFAGEHPPLDTVGVEVVDDVAPFEQMKLRVLNGLHSACAYLGAHDGIETIDAVVCREGRFLRQLLDEIVPTLSPPPGSDVRDYGGTVLERFANPWLGHRCQQVATDGSVKLVQRLYPTVLIRLQRQLPVDACTRVLALWIDHIARSGNDLVDPNAAQLLRRLDGARSSSEMARAILTDAAIVPARLGQADVTDLVAHHLDALHTRKTGGPTVSS